MAVDPAVTVRRCGSHRVWNGLPAGIWTRMQSEQRGFLRPTRFGRTTIRANPRSNHPPNPQPHDSCGPPHAIQVRDNAAIPNLKR
jgi:hypothetical protein